MDGCSYWTDDWEKIASTESHIIPHCPMCGGVGMQMEAKDWFASAKNYQDDDHPGYVRFLETHKEVCMKGIPWMLAYEKWQSHQ